MEAVSASFCQLLSAASTPASWRVRSRHFLPCVIAPDDDVGAGAVGRVQPVVVGGGQLERESVAAGCRGRGA